MGLGTACCCVDKVRGACCLSDGSCVDIEGETRVQQCEQGLGGEYQGDGTACVFQPCPESTGACCLPDGTCLDVATQGECETNQGGVWQGLQSACATVICPGNLPTEACCYDDGTCEDTAAVRCLLRGGVPQGPGTTCDDADVDCDPPPVGPIRACCLDPLFSPNGEDGCQDVTEQTCSALAGIWYPGFNCGGVNCDCDIVGLPPNIQISFGGFVYSPPADDRGAFPSIANVLGFLSGTHIYDLQSCVAISLSTWRTFPGPIDDSVSVNARWLTDGIVMWYSVSVSIASFGGQIIGHRESVVFRSDPRPVPPRGGSSSPLPVSVPGTISPAGLPSFEVIQSESVNPIVPEAIWFNYNGVGIVAAEVDT